MLAWIKGEKEEKNHWGQPLGILLSIPDEKKRQKKKTLKKSIIIIAVILSDYHLVCESDFHNGERFENEKTLLLLRKHSDLDVLAIQLPWNSSAMYYLLENAIKCPSVPGTLLEAEGVERHKHKLETLTSLHCASSTLGGKSLPHCVSPFPVYVGWTQCPQSTSLCQHLQMLLLLEHLPSVSSQLFCTVLLTYQSSLLITKLKGDSWSHNLDSPPFLSCTGTWKSLQTSVFLSLFGSLEYISHGFTVH